MRQNAIILAAGFSSRFSLNHPKGLTRVKGEILIERQITQLKSAGITEIILVVGYQKEQFYYLKDKHNIIIVENTEYKTRNNHSSIYAAKQYLANTYICSSDNYFTQNPFKVKTLHSYYAAVFQPGITEEWCLTTNSDGLITNVQIGGKHSWHMLGHAYWTEDFSKRFLDILEKEYNEPDTANALWEHLYIRHLNELPMYIQKYPSGTILEFDTLEELILFDNGYNNS